MSNSCMQYLAVAALLFSSVQPADADPILGVIDIRPVLARKAGSSNSLGLAYNPRSDVLYLSHFAWPFGGDLRGFIYTLDLQGNLLDELDFGAVYKPGTYPTGLSYDQKSGRLYVFAEGVEPGLGAVVGMSPDGRTIFSEFAVPIIDSGGGILARDDGLWLASFAGDLIRQYSLDGASIGSISVANSFPGFPGPDDLASSFNNGFFILDHFGRRIVEVDIAGHELTAVSTAALTTTPAPGRGLAIASDVNTRRVFLQVNNQEIYTLSAEFVEPIPEPATLGLLSMGLAGVAYKVSRRRKSPGSKDAAQDESIHT